MASSLHVRALVYRNNILLIYHTYASTIHVYVRVRLDRLSTALAMALDECGSGIWAAHLDPLFKRFQHPEEALLHVRNQVFAFFSLLHRAQRTRVYSNMCIEAKAKAHHLFATHEHTDIFPQKWNNVLNKTIATGTDQICT